MTAHLLAWLCMQNKLYSRIREEEISRGLRFAKRIFKLVKTILYVVSLLVRRANVATTTLSVKFSLFKELIPNYSACIFNENPVRNSF
jgi:hypothetical protein